MTRGTKKTIILCVYLTLFALFGYWAYSALKPDPTCFDGKKNQGEKGIDCGGPCVPCEKQIEAREIETTEAAFIYGGPGKYDVLAKISNPNSQFGSPFFKYSFLLKNSSGEIIAGKEGSSFILPAESKYLIETSLDSREAPSDVEFEISETSWQEFFNYEKPKLNIYSKRYNLISSGVGYSEAYGLLRNENPFDFNLIKVKVILRDVFGRPVAVNTTEMRTVKAGEERDFRLLWPSSFPGDVHSDEMEAEADVFNAENFIKMYIQEKEPQKYN